MRPPFGRGLPDWLRWVLVLLAILAAGTLAILVFVAGVAGVVVFFFEPLVSWLDW